MRFNRPTPNPPSQPPARPPNQLTIQSNYQLGPPVVPFYPFLVGRRVPLLKTTTEKSWHPYSKSSPLEDLDQASVPARPCPRPFHRLQAELLRLAIARARRAKGALSMTLHYTGVFLGCLLARVRACVGACALSFLCV